MEGLNSVPEVPQLFYQEPGSASALSEAWHRTASYSADGLLSHGFHPGNWRLKVGGLEGLGAGAGHLLMRWLSAQLGRSPWWQHLSITAGPDPPEVPVRVPCVSAETDCSIYTQ